MARITVSCSRAAVTPTACSRSNISPPVCAPYTVHPASSPHHPPFPHVGTTKRSLLQGPGGDGSEITAKINRFWLETNICRWELPASMAQHLLMSSSSGLHAKCNLLSRVTPYANQSNSTLTDGGKSTVTHARVRGLYQRTWHILH